jgi:soluble lytic murein transglycosylase-like protein
MTLLQNRKCSAVPLFDQNADHSFIPVRSCTAAARSVGASATAASSVAALRPVARMLCMMVILAASMLSTSAAYAQQGSSAKRSPSARSLLPLAFVAEASNRFGVPEHWIRAVMHVESNGKQRARSSIGAMGLMQIMPKTWTELRARYRLGADPYDVRDNILAGAAYIRELYDRYGAPGFLAAYNAGPGRYERHLATGRPLPEETQAYVATLAPMINRAQVSMPTRAVARSFAWANSSLFAARSAGISPDRSSSAAKRQSRSTRAQGIVDLSALGPHSGNLFVHRNGEMRSR